MPVQVIHHPSEARQWVKAQRAAGCRVGFVPTMGALHAGHASLIRRAAEECDRAVVSVFVNPTQFGPGEDFERYPRDLPRDTVTASEAGADMIFAPSPAEMYPSGFCSRVEVDRLTEGLCGACRPGHFAGVTTVVMKLFHIIPADVSYFGQKDFQQAMVIRRMVRDLDVDMEIRVCPTVRESDGLAMSSRNAYLSPDERRRALALSRALKAARQLFAEGERDRMVLLKAMRAVVNETAPGAPIDYIEVVSPEELTPADPVTPESVALLAVRIGSTRLIDNMPLGCDTSVG